MPKTRPVSVTGSNPDYVNILLHGLFFMDFHSDGLAVSTPDVDGHQFKVGCKGLISDLAHDVDWSDPNGPLKKGSVTSFNPDYPQILQFSKSTVGHLIGPYRVRIELPFPDTIIPLRLGKLSNFKYKHVGTGGIGDQVVRNCSANGTNDDLALITCLRYERNAPATGQTLTYSFYAEHLMASGTNTNGALISSQVLFENRQAFDLQIDDTYSAPDIQPNDVPTYGVTAEDEYTLLEIQVHHPATRGPNVMNCMQFGLL